MDMFEIPGRFEAQQAIEALRQGTVPRRYASELMIGRNFWLDAIIEDMEYVGNGASKIRLLCAHYGGGKSDFLAAVETVALERGFLVANVELQSREAPLDRFEIIFPKIMRSLTCGGGDQDVLENVFNGWINSAQLYGREQINREVRTISRSLDEAPQNSLNFIRRRLQLGYNPQPPYLPILKKYASHKCFNNRYLQKS